MPIAENTLLAQELARTLIQFKRLGWQPSAGQEIRQSEFHLLATLLQANGNGVKVSDLSTQLQITPPAVTHIINSLEEGGYVERLADAADRRIVLIRPTERGKQVIAVMKEKFLESLQGLIDFLGEPDSQELLRLLSVTVAYFKEK